MIDIRNLDGRYRCIVRYNGMLWAAVLSPEKLSPSKEHIRIGGFYSDELPTAWYRVDQIVIVEVLSKVGPVPEPRSWIDRLLDWLQPRVMSAKVMPPHPWPEPPNSPRSGP